MDYLSSPLLGYFILLSFGFIIFRYVVPRDYLRFGKLSPWVTFLQSLLFFLYGGFPYLYLENDWPAVSVSPCIHIIGKFILFTGLAVLFYGMYKLGLSRSVGRGEPQLERSGLYSLSRNPQAIACGLYVVGFAILWPSWYAAGWALLYAVLIHMMVMAEEKHLLQTHGLDYEEYCRRVSRYFTLKT